MSGASELPIHERLKGRCTCGHTAEQHGSKGMVCCGFIGWAPCSCRQFEAEFDSKEPVRAKSIKGSD
jgi:hypothetical protein